MSGTTTGGGGVNSGTSAAFTGLPVSKSPLVENGVYATTHWYRFFQAIWIKLAFGVSNEITLQSVAQAAGLAQSTANDAGTAAANNQTDIANLLNDLTAEINRAATAESNLQAQITTIRNNLTDLTNRVTRIESRLTAANIP